MSKPGEPCGDETTSALSPNEKVQELLSCALAEAKAGKATNVVLVLMDDDADRLLATDMSTDVIGSLFVCMVKTIVNQYYPLPYVLADLLSSSTSTTETP